MELETHRYYLNAVLLETNPDQAIPLATHAAEEIARLGNTHASYRKIEWLPGVQKEDKTDPKSFHSSVHLLSGSFDVAAIFLSSHLDFGSWLQKDHFMAAGQDINSCLLPKATSLGCDDDFNQQFIDAFSKEEVTDLDWNRSFLGIIKIKLNPHTTWPAEHETLEQCRLKLNAQLTTIWSEISSWRGITNEAPDVSPTTPLTALGLSCGWNEVLVATLTDSPAKLLELSIKLRQLPWPEADDAEQLHLVHTSITSIGHDYRLSKQAIERLDESDVFAEDLLPETAAESLIQILRDTPELREARPTAADEDRHVFYQVGCHLYPGHETRVHHFFQGLAKAIYGDEASGETTSFEAGKRDLWSPRIPVADPKSVNGPLAPQVAAVLVQAIKKYLRGTLDADGSAEVPDAFDFFVRIGFAGNGIDSCGATTLAKHKKGLPKTALGKTSGQGTTLPESRRSLTRRIRRSLRILQIPYSLSEQILHVVNTFWWGNDREILWEESVEVAPVIFALANYLESKERWWSMGNFTCDQSPPSLEPQASHRENHAKQVSRMLSELLEPNILVFLQSFRAVFYNRHLSSYLTDGTPDLNLRYRGAIQQLLSGTQMILDTLVSIVLGDRRASMVAIGDSVSPEVSIHCSIVTVQQSGATFRSPLFLESIGHEVGHQLLVELNRDFSNPSWRNAAGLGADSENDGLNEAFAKLQEEHRRVTETIFHGELSNERVDEVSLFIESTADLVEFMLLWNGRDLEEWAKSFLLRMVLASPPTLPYGDTDHDRGDVPVYDDRRIVSGILRAALVRSAEALVNNESLEAHGIFAQLRKILLEQTLVGSSQEAYAILSNEENWKRFIEENVLQRQWLKSKERQEIIVSYYRRLVNYLQVDRPHREAKDILALINSAFADYRKVLLAGMHPSLYIRTWMNEEERKRAREGSLRFCEDFSHPWVAVPQPLVRHQELEDHQRALAAAEDGDHGDAWKPLEDLEIKSLVFQRGSIVPFDSEFGRHLDLAQQRFWSRLFLALPCWRRTILRKTHRMMPEDEGSD